MKNSIWIRCLKVITICIILSSCGTTAHKKPSPSTHKTAANLIQINHVNRTQASQEIMLQSMSLIGTPYRFGGSDRSTGFDCSGMIQHVYGQALQVQLPRTAKDMANRSRAIQDKDLQVGDLVFFNTSGNPYSHVGIYIGNRQFIHAPSSNGTIRTASLDNPYFKQRYLGARTFFKK